MYEEHFGFREPPFRITPDPRFLYRNPCVEEAAAALAYGIERRKGFLSLVGEAGTGKTTLLRHVLDTLAGNVRTVGRRSFQRILSSNGAVWIDIFPGSTTKGSWVITRSKRLRAKRVTDFVGRPEISTPRSAMTRTAFGCSGLGWLPALRASTVPTDR